MAQTKARKFLFVSSRVLLVICVIGIFFSFFYVGTYASKKYNHVNKYKKVNSQYSTKNNVSSNGYVVDKTIKTVKQIDKNDNSQVVIKNNKKKNVSIAKKSNKNVKNKKNSNSKKKKK